MRICYILPTAGISGGINIVIEHAHRLIDQGHDVFFLQTEAGKTFSWYPDFRVPMFNIHDQSSIRYYLREDVDVLIATGWQTVYEIIWRKLPAHSYVYFVQADEKMFYPEDSTEHDLAEFTYTLPFHYLSEAKWICEMLQRDYGHQVQYARNGLNFDFFHQAEPVLPKPKNKVRILLEGPLSIPRKKMDDAFLAVEGIDAEVWLVTSDGALQPWQKPDLMFKKVPITMMKHIYSSCDILVKLPSVEGMFGPPLEMMACGGTCITSDVLGHDEYIIDGYNSSVVPIGDFRAAKDAIIKLIENPDLMMQYRQNGLETARDFAWEKTIDILEAYFARILQEEKSRETYLDTKTVCQKLSLEDKQRSISLRLHLRRYFEITWQIGLIDEYLSTDKLIDSATCQLSECAHLNLIRAKGWAFSLDDIKRPEKVYPVAENVLSESVKFSWQNRPDLKGWIGAKAEFSGFVMEVFSSTDLEEFAIETQCKDNGENRLAKLGKEQGKYGYIEALALFRCHKATFPEKFATGCPDGVCLDLKLSKVPEFLKIGFSESKAWRPGFSLLYETERASVIRIDDLEFIRGIFQDDEKEMLIWSDSDIDLFNAKIESSPGVTLV